MTRTAIFCFLGGLTAAMQGTRVAQHSSNWRVYKMADGLREPSCFALTISTQGKVLVRHLNSPAVSELDGCNVRVFPAPVGQPSGRVYESPAGQLWTASPEGLQEFKDRSWLLHPLPRFAEQFSAVTSRLTDPVPLCPVRQGRVIFLLPDGIFEFNSEGPGPSATQVLLSSSQIHLGKFAGLAPARGGGLWIAAQRGLATTQGPLRNITPDSHWRQSPLP